MTAFEDALLQHAKQINVFLDHLLSPRPQLNEVLRPKKLMAAMRHGVLNGGKRLRPFLLMQTAALFDANQQASLRVAAALECLHCYSLIHDDLPAMDNDSLRRGQPTVHKAFDEATAILAGDALLTLAFDIIADDATQLAPAIKIKLITQLARAAGAGGMIGGQMLDIDAEHHHPDEQGIIALQAMKTGALIRFSCEAGAIVANAPQQDCQQLAEFGSAIGLAFQLTDDILDITADTATLGKTAKKDLADNKATLLSLHGLEWGKKQRDGLIAQANELIAPYGQKAILLQQAANFVAQRSN